jgi:glycerol-3-phosphate dehydrogenase (NAD(P)+)
MAQRLGDYVQGDQILVHTARGLEAATGRTSSAIIQAECGIRKIGALAGALRPQLLDEGRRVVAVVASRFDEVSRRAAALLCRPTFRVHRSWDLEGIELAGAYRSVGALFGGIIDGLVLGDAVRAFVVTAGLREAASLATRQSGDPLTFTGYGGAGDLVAAVAHRAGATHEAGLRLARGDRGDLLAAAEAVDAVRGACVLGARIRVATPLADGLRRIIDESAEPCAVIDALLASNDACEKI